MSRFDEYIEAASSSYNRDMETRVFTPDIKTRIQLRKELEREMDVAFESLKSAPILSLEFARSVRRAPVLAFKHGRNIRSLHKKAEYATRTLHVMGNGLVRDTAEIDIERSSQIQVIKQEHNPYIQYLEPFGDLLKSTNVAIQAIDNTVSHINDAEWSKGAQFVTRSSQGGVGQFVNKAGQAGEVYSVGMIAQSLGDVRYHIHIVYDKAQRLRTTALPQSTENLSAQDVATTFAGSVVLSQGVLGAIAQFASIASLESLRGNLNQARGSLVALHGEASIPINKYNAFEGNRQQRIANINHQVKQRMLTKSVGGPSLQEMCSDTVVELTGKDYPETHKFYSKCIKGFIAAGLAIAATGTYVAIDSGVFADEEENRQTPAEVFNPT